MSQQHPLQLTGELLDDGSCITLVELARACQVPAEIVMEFVEFGVVEPREQPTTAEAFHYSCVLRLQRALRLERDLGLNRAGAALAVDLLDELSELRARVQRLEALGLLPN